jgi:sugar phosphate permease
MTAPTLPQRLPFYYGWVNVVMAAVAMTATFPGRTQGLGIISKPLVKDLGIEVVQLTQINLVTSLLGALFCLPVGYLIDRIGVRGVTSLVVFALGASSFALGAATTPTSLFFGMLLVRGLGQSALSIAALAVVGKWFRRRLGQAMGALTVLLTFGFIGVSVGLDVLVDKVGWRTAWNSLAWGVLACGPFLWLLIRNTPESCGVTPDPEPEAKLDATSDGETQRSFTLGETLRTPAFWIITIGTSTFNMIFSALLLLNQFILEEHGFSLETANLVMPVMAGIGLLTNFAAGAVATRSRIGMLLGLGLAAMAGMLVMTPHLRAIGSVMWYGAALGVTGGLVTVVHFSAFGHLFGRAHLGRIQGTAQAVSVVASAIGPELFSESEKWTGSYNLIFRVMAATVAVLAVAAFLMPQPVRREQTEDEASPVSAINGVPEKA